MPPTQSVYTQLSFVFSVQPIEVPLAHHLSTPILDDDFLGTSTVNTVSMHDNLVSR